MTSLKVKTLSQIENSPIKKYLGGRTVKFSPLVLMVIKKAVELLSTLVVYTTADPAKMDCM